MLSIKKNASKILKIGAIIGVTSSGYIFYKQKELRNSPLQILQGTWRNARLLGAGIQMVWIYKNKFSQDNLEEKHKKAAHVLRVCFEKNAGTYIKLGQVLACLELLIPVQYCDEMSVMFQKAPHSSIKEVEKVLENELGLLWRNKFSHFEEEPISSASLAQVHEAILQNGQRVAVKVQHPWIQENVQLDIDTVSFFLNLGKKLFKNFNYTWISDDMKSTLPQEVDFMNELLNTERLKPLIQNENVYVPKFFKPLCTSKVLVMEYIDGYSITDTKRLEQDKINIQDIAKSLTNLFNKMIFQEGFFHADPHPGNIFVQKFENGKYHIVLLDHGLYKQLSPESHKKYSSLWSGIILKDEEMIKKACEDIGVGENYRLFTSIITYQKYDQVMGEQEDIQQRIKGNEDYESYQKRAREEAIKHQKSILHCLQNMDKNFLLILKVNNYMNAIDKKLGEPVHNYYYLSKYCMQNYQKNYINEKPFWSRVYFKLRYFKLMYSLLMYEMYLNFAQFFNQFIMKNISKDGLRSIYRKRRQEMTLLDIQNKSELILNNLKPIVSDFKYIGGYLPIHNEVDCLKIMKGLDKHQFSLCRVTDYKNRNMQFYEIDLDNMQLIKEKFCLEPDPQKTHKAEQLDVILTPLVAFDEQLNRIGYGKGFYDNYFLKNKVLKIGLAFELQKLEQIYDFFNKEINNVKLDLIVTESNVYRSN